MTPESLKQAREIIAATWPGPWGSDKNPDNNGAIVHTKDFQRICDCYEFLDVYSQNFFHDRANARFIAAARTGWPEALDEIERLRKEVILEQGHTNKYIKFLHEMQGERDKLRAVAEAAKTCRNNLDVPYAHDSECAWIVDGTKCICGVHEFKKALQALEEK